MTFNTGWILHVLANTICPMEEQKLWAQTAACGASLVTRYFEKHSSQGGWQYTFSPTSPGLECM